MNTLTVYFYFLFLFFYFDSLMSYLNSEKSASNLMSIWAQITAGEIEWNMAWREVEKYRRCFRTSQEKEYKNMKSETEST